jgi:endonuclease/exonuclease/phosphatase family metal-dependent hydrolase
MITITTADDLLRFAHKCGAQGEWIVIAGDFNEVIGSTPDGLTPLCSECGLYDPIVDCHQTTGFSTYTRGKDVLDYILVDDNVLRTITATGYEAFGIHILSDHPGVYINVSTSGVSSPCYLCRNAISPNARTKYNRISRQRTSIWRIITGIGK